MGAVQETVSSRNVDHRDDYRNGFVDAVIFQQGIRQPTAEQVQQAIDLLTRFRTTQATRNDDWHSAPRFL